MENIVRKGNFTVLNSLITELANEKNLTNASLDYFMDENNRVRKEEREKKIISSKEKIRRINEFISYIQNKKIDNYENSKNDENFEKLIDRYINNKPLNI